MTTAKDRAEAEAAKLGCTWDIGRVGEYRHITLDAPKGQVFTQGSHCLCADIDPGIGLTEASGYADILERMELQPCDTPDCDICEEL